MRDGPAVAAEGAALLAAVEGGAPVGGAAAAGDEAAGAVRLLVVQALAELLARPSEPSLPGAVDDVVAGLHRRASALAASHPASWVLATSSGELVDAWTRHGTWARVLGDAAARAGAGPAARRRLVLVVLLHLWAVRPPVPAAPLVDDDATGAAALTAYPSVARLRPLLSCEAPAGGPADPAELATLLAVVDRELRRSRQASPRWSPSTGEAP